MSLLLAGSLVACGDKDADKPADKPTEGGATLVRVRVTRSLLKVTSQLRGSRRLLQGELSRPSRGGDADDRCIICRAVHIC